MPDRLSPKLSSLSSSSTTPPFFPSRGAANGVDKRPILSLQPDDEEDDEQDDDAQNSDQTTTTTTHVAQIPFDTPTTISPPPPRLPLLPDHVVIPITHSTPSFTPSSFGGPMDSALMRSMSQVSAADQATFNMATMDTRRLTTGQSQSIHKQQQQQQPAAARSDLKQGGWRGERGDVNDDGDHDDDDDPEHHRRAPPRHSAANGQSERGYDLQQESDNEQDKDNPWSGARPRPQRKCSRINLALTVAGAALLCAGLALGLGVLLKSPTDPDGTMQRVGVASSALTASAQPTETGNPSVPQDPTLAINALFRQQYAAVKKSVLVLDRSPVILVNGAYLTCMQHGQLGDAGAQRKVYCQTPLYHLLKRVAHVPLAIYTTFIGEVFQDALSSSAIAAANTMLSLIARTNQALAQNSSDAAFPGYANLTATQQARQAELLATSQIVLQAALANNRIGPDELESFAAGVSAALSLNVHDAAYETLNAIHAAVLQCQTEFGISPADWANARGIVNGPHMPKRDNLVYQYLRAALSDSSTVEEDHDDSDSSAPHNASTPRVFYATNMATDAAMMDLIATHDLDFDLGGSFFGNPEVMHRDILANATEEYLAQLVASGELPLTASKAKRDLSAKQHTRRDRVAQVEPPAVEGDMKHLSLVQRLLLERRKRDEPGMAERIKNLFRPRSRGSCPFHP
ncbi:hypothetical protein CAOG_04718 [Capsaspora owczarzaki ATCC 30864]|uniref:Uncharacterized protein n=1 Tax=Capsaspora owczarzaki (strain ATCC 30864) TaxID=595528 RepID=A0A0D2UFW8_CAPO3|nr:hypothetical protein CAOG_04718 [Capsaspora owczarzaki ATCC 30864]KJE94016.1 hypothetical protein CAOG_004718 [Capsaspora owczarzaki ATCC 30864]|eukprot:XP_004347465.1 hypothetical protein CAOG_04718 [Capsaspora owczarzaki ATCC 30864]